ncbi:hypothetical protein GW17_00056353 [Ensete ventricosum]|nr:hypothetical protein GW17_00056353 [Ensete ventricosum]
MVSVGIHRRLSGVRKSSSIGDHKLARNSPEVAGTSPIGDRELAGSSSEVCREFANRRLGAHSGFVKTMS